MSLQVTIESSSLTPYQKTIVQVVYTELKNQLMTIINEIKEINIEAISVEDISKYIFIIISKCIKLVEKTKVNNKKLSGSDKKQIVLELGKIAIYTEIDNESITEIIIPIYDTVAEEILETIIDVSSHVNTEVRKGCLQLFNKIKHNILGCLRGGQTVSAQLS